MQSARALGMRAFDASLVIAMVQDVARRGEVPEGHPPLTPGLAERLTVVPEPRRRVEKVGLVQRAAAACLIATGLVALAMMWVQGG